MPSVQSRRFLPLDRRVYDYLDNEITRKELAGEDVTVSLARIRAAHFTADIPKPWDCMPARSELGRALQNAWWVQRARFAKDRGLVNGMRRCQPGYEPLRDPNVA